MKPVWSRAWRLQRWVQVRGLEPASRWLIYGRSRPVHRLAVVHTALARATTSAPAYVVELVGHA